MRTSVAISTAYMYNHVHTDIVYLVVCKLVYTCIIKVIAMVVPFKAQIFVSIPIFQSFHKDYHLG